MNSTEAPMTLTALAADQEWNLVESLKGIAHGQRVPETIDTLVRLAAEYQKSARDKLAESERLKKYPISAHFLAHEKACDALDDARVAKAYNDMVDRLTKYLH
jgi:molecular chaperone GrpE (heat shock protein)